MQRRKFSREFKIEAVRLVRERGVSVAQAWLKRLGTSTSRERSSQMSEGIWHGSEAGVSRPRSAEA
jgi:transposase-like protein